MGRRPKIAIIYASSLCRTKLMAESIAEGARAEAIADGARTVNGVDVVLKDAYDAKAEDVKDADGILLGGSTYNYKLIKAMDPFLKVMAELDLKGKVGAAFGSYGWSGEGVPTLILRMKSFGMNVIEPGITAIQVPTPDDIERSFKLGRTGRTVAQGVLA
jgi:flavodoxin I